MVANQSQLPQRSKSLKVECEDLSYQTMTVRDCGTMMTREEKEYLRSRYGYCTTCPGVPILLFIKSKSRLVPFAKKEPRTAESECLDGVCLRCNPDKDPRRQKFAALKSSTTSSSHMTTSSHSSQSKKNIQRDLSNGALAMSQSRRDLFQCQRDPSNASFSRSSSKRDLGHDSPSDSAGSPYLMTRKGQQQSPRFGGGRKSLRSPDQSPSQSYSRKSIQNHESDTASLCGSVSSFSLGSHKSPEPSPKIAERKSIRETGDSTTTFTEEKPVPSPRAVKKKTPTSEISGEILPPPPPPPPPETSLQRTCSKSILSSPDVERERPSISSPNISRTFETAKPVSGLKRSSTFGSIASSNSLVPLPQFRESKSLGSHKSTAVAPENSKSCNVGQNLESLIRDLGEAKDYEFLIEIVVNAMQSYSVRKPLQVLCLLTIVKICKEEARHKERLVGTKAIEEIVFAMKRFDSCTEIQIAAGAAISALAGSEKARTLLVQHGACRLLVKNLKNFMADSKVAASTITALRGLSLEASAREAFGLVLASKYVSAVMMEHPSIASLQRDGCAFLSNVSVDMQSQEVSVVSRDLLEAIVNAILAHRDSESVVSVACFALCNLTYEKKNLRTLRDIEYVFSLFEPSEANNVLGSQDAYDVLERLQMSQAEDASLEDHAAESLKMVALKADEIGAVSEVKGLMENFVWSATVSADCFDCLVFLVARSELHLEAILKENGADELICHLKRHGTNLSVLENASKLFAILSQKSDSVRRAFFEAGICNLLVDAMEKNQNGVSVTFLEVAFSILIEMVTVDNTWDPIRMEVTVNAVRSAVESQKDNDSLQDLGCALLSKLGEDDWM